MTKIMCRLSNNLVGQIYHLVDKCQERDVDAQNRVFFVLHVNTCNQSAVLEVAIHAGKLDAVSRKKEKTFYVPDIVHRPVVVHLLMSPTQIGIILFGNVILDTLANRGMV